MRLRRIFKPLINRIMPPLARWYLRKPRQSRWGGVLVDVPRGVFHPGLYLSTRFMLEYLSRQAVDGKSLLELGAGSGMISIVSAKRGARVTATDISHQAVATILANMDSNQLKMNVLISDLFADLDDFAFDWIVVNPPYYPADPQTEEEHAWFCGAEFQYFHRFFKDLGRYRHADSKVVMVLSEDCKLAEIAAIAAANGWRMTTVDKRRRWGEWNYIYEVQAL